MNTTTTTPQEGGAFRSYLLAPSTTTPEAFLQLQELICDLHISQHLNQMVLMGVIDIYLYRAKTKAENYNIYKRTTKFILNRAREEFNKQTAYLRMFERDYLSRLLGSTTPAHISHYQNTGGVQTRLQHRWCKQFKTQLDDLYVVFLRKAEHFGCKYPDFMACIEMLHFAAGMIVEDAAVVYSRVKQLAQRRWNVKTPDFTTVKSLEKRAQMLQQMYYKGDPHDGFMNTKLAKLGQEFCENVYLASDGDILENICIAAIMDYTDFYCAYTIELMQKGELTEYVSKKMREDFDNLYEDAEPLYQDFMGECRMLADYLPQYEDIEDLKECISEVNEDIPVPPTPALDKFRQQVMYVRKNQRANDKSKSANNTN
jgi:hypothetical protein